VDADASHVIEVGGLGFSLGFSVGFRLKNVIIEVGGLGFRV
jgi:hypothetical protein